MNKRVSAAVGGKRGKMPHFFQYSRNGRRDDGTPPEKCAPDNDSTMNRICREFNTIGNLDLRFAGVAPFNYVMFLDENDVGYDQSIAEVFAASVQEALSCTIDAAHTTDLAEKSRKLKNELITEMISENIERVMPLETAYCSVVKYLFTDNLSRTSLKSEFWNVFGDIAVEKLKKNLDNCTSCPKCGMKYPLWSTHTCSQLGNMVECVSCGKIVPRTGSKQCRCPECQKEYRKLQVRRNVQNMRKKAG